MRARTLIEEAVTAGARRFKACETLGITLRTYQRWNHSPSDGRPGALRPEPKHKLTQEERASIIEIVNRPEYASLPPHQIVPRLADEGVYVASESSFYRVMKNHGQLNRRGRERVHERRAPTTHLATAPNQVWCWDIVRHEALFDRMAVKDRHDPAVAAAGYKLRTVQIGKRR